MIDHTNVTDDTDSTHRAGIFIRIDSHPLSIKLIHIPDSIQIIFIESISTHKLLLLSYR